MSNQNSIPLPSKEKGGQMASWNPWHGCHKLSEGCRNCYVYRIDERHGKDSSVITRTRDFDLPVRRKRDKSYKIKPGTLVYTCFSSDFFVEDADRWRPEAWRMGRTGDCRRRIGKPSPDMQL